MRKVLPALALILIGCSAVSALLTWLPVAETSAESIVSVAAPGNPTLGVDIKNFGGYISDAIGIVTSWQSAGSTNSGAAKVVAELGVLIGSFNKIEADVASVDSGLSNSDKTWVTVGEGIVLVGLETYQTQIAASAGMPIPTNADINGPCYGIHHEADGSVSAWANCDSSEPVYWSSLQPELYFAEPPQAAKTTVVTRKPAKTGSFKRQWNALCRKYGHSERQIPLTLKEHLHVK